MELRYELEQTYVKWSSGRSSLRGWRLTLAELWNGKGGSVRFRLQSETERGTLTALGPLHPMGQPLDPTD